MEENDMICIDSNIIIYVAKKQNENLRNWIASQILIASIISKIEVLGYHKIKETETDAANVFFSFCEIIPLGERIVNKAINLRKNKSMSVGDAIIAAIALIKDATLLTANIKDFQHINDLKLIDMKEIYDSSSSQNI